MLNSTTLKAVAADPLDTVDLTYLSNICDHDALFMREMIDNFIQEMPNNVSSLKEHITAANWQDTKKIAHKIKPALQFMGLVKTLEYAKSMELLNEQEAKQQDVLPVYELIAINVYQAINALEKITLPEHNGQ